MEIPSGGSLALAGMIQEQTKQQINGVPGLMQLPVLGALFKSRDYINNQTELMVLVTPYIVHAVAQKQLSRPDDGFADPERSGDRPARPPQPHLRRRRQGRAAAERLPRQIRIHSRLSGTERQSMTAFLGDDRQTPRRHGAARVGGRRSRRLAGRLLHAARRARAAYPNDYRERHPITLKEGEHTVEVFVGRNRGGLTPSQRADVLAFAQLWRREATGGIIVDVPQGGPTERAAADSMREVHSILAAAGVPRNAVFVRAYRPAGAALASIKINYSKLVADGRPVRPVAARSRPSLDADLRRKPPVLESRLRHPAQSRRHGRQSGRPGAAARRSAGLYRAPLGRDRQVPQG